MVSDDYNRPRLCRLEQEKAALRPLPPFRFAEYDIEQLYRDNRLNQIHEGTNGIQALDLLGRKVTQQQGAAVAAFGRRVAAAVAEARAAGLETEAAALESAFAQLVSVTRSLVAAMTQDPTRGLANATVYLELTSRVVFAWLWLRQATVAARALAAGRDTGTMLDPAVARYIAQHLLYAPTFTTEHPD